jgi:putative ABC transport system ATP-binding protein
MILSARGLTYHVGDRIIVDGVDADAHGGRLLAVCGPSGAGKSTLLALLGGLLRPDTGAVALDGEPVRAGDPAVRRRIGFVLQGYGLVGALTGRENVAIALQSRRATRSAVRDRTTEVLEQVGLEDVADHLSDEMSGGQQQRVAVARALAARPDVVLADEPTAELDAENRERIVALLVAHARGGAIVAIASHDPDVVAQCDDVLELDSGRAVAAPLSATSSLRHGSR